MNRKRQSGRATTPEAVGSGGGAIRGASFSSQVVPQQNVNPDISSLYRDWDSAVLNRGKSGRSSTPPSEVNNTQFHLYPYDFGGFVGSQNVQNYSKKVLTLTPLFDIVAAHTEQLKTKMRTKALILSAAMVAAGALSSQAQSVYSVNVVGYVNQPVQANKFYLINNPLDLSASGGNAVSNVLPITDPNWDSTTIYLFQAGALNPVETYIGGFGWYPGTNVLAPGQGYYVYPGTNGTLTFTGTVVTNSSQILGAGFNLVSSAFPISTNLVGIGLQGVDSDTIYRFDPVGQSLNDLITFIGGYGWYDGNANNGGPTNGPNVNVGEAFFYYNANTPNTWTQSFTIH